MSRLSTRILILTLALLGFLNQDATHAAEPVVPLEYGGQTSAPKATSATDCPDHLRCYENATYTPGETPFDIPPGDAAALARRLSAGGEPQQRQRGGPTEVGL